MKPVIPVVTAVLLFAGACSSRTPSDDREMRTADSTIVVREDVIPEYLEFHGTVRAGRRAELSTRMAGRVDSVLVDIGEHVDEGQILVTLASADIRLKRQKAKAALALAEAAYREAVKEAGRMDTLFSQDAVPEVRRDRAHLELAAAETRVAVSRAELSEVENAATYSSIAAPWSGTIVDRLVDPGDLAAPGRPIIVIDDDRARDAEVYLPVDVARRLSVGSAVTVSYNHAVHTATVRRIAGAADSGAHLVKILIRVPEDWIPGAPVVVSIPAGAHRGVVVDRQYLVMQGQLTGVRIQTPYGQVLRWIRLGGMVPDSTGKVRYEVVSGLRPGEEVVVR